MSIPLLSFVLALSILGAFNPSAIGVLVLFLSKLLGSGKTPGKTSLLAAAYVIGLFIVYSAAGLVLLGLSALLPDAAAPYFVVLAALLAIFAAVFEIKDFFWYDRGPSLHIPKGIAAVIEHWPIQRINVLSAGGVGVVAGVGELVCTGAPYVLAVSLLRLVIGTHSMWLVALYAAVFTLPLIIIFLLVAGGLRISSVHRRKEQNKPAVRLLIGLLLIVLSWLALLVVNGVVALG